MRLIKIFNQISDMVHCHHWCSPFGSVGVLISTTFLYSAMKPHWKFHQCTVHRCSRGIRYLPKEPAKESRKVGNYVSCSWIWWKLLRMFQCLACIKLVPSEEANPQDANWQPLPHVMRACRLGTELCRRLGLLTCSAIQPQVAQVDVMWCLSLVWKCPGFSRHLYCIVVFS